MLEGQVLELEEQGTSTLERLGNTATGFGKAMPTGAGSLLIRPSVQSVQASNPSKRPIRPSVQSVQASKG
jgi:hypothetical protein